jgi:hypothetical protein
LTLNGCYRPPLGRLGSGLDRAVLHRIAAATIRALLRGIAGMLTEPKNVPAHYQKGTGQKGTGTTSVLRSPRESRTH